MRTNTRSQATRYPRLRAAALWAIQALLAALFLFAGGVKLSMPGDALAQATGLPETFMRFIAVCEILGALGLILPGLLNIGRALTSLAAAGLVVIMIGAVTVTLLLGHGATAAMMPGLVGVLAGAVARGRRTWWAHRRVSGVAPLVPNRATMS